MLRLREIIGAGAEEGTMSYNATIWENGDSLIWTKSSDPKKEIKQAKYDLLLDLTNAYRGISVCPQCTKKRRIMSGVDYCIGFVLAGLE